MANYLTKRNGTYYFMRRVPELVAPFEQKKFVRASLKTKDKREAIRKSVMWNDYLESHWQALLAENGVSSQNEYDLMVKQAKLQGFEYKPVQEVSQETVDEIIKRVSLASKHLDQPQTVSALLGGQDKPTIKLSQLWDDFYAFKKPDLTGKSNRQIDRWITPRIKAYKNFIKVCGDLLVDDITREHILNFRAWWANRLDEEEMTPNSANKDFTYLRALLAYAQDNVASVETDVNSLFARVRFKERESERRPFPTEHIENNLLNPRNLEGLHEECRLFLYAMADTGARPSELLGLNAARGDICLDAEIPYIFIRPDKDREIKNQYSKRQIPLVGSALYAFQQLPQGFKHYYRRADQLSANLNSFLREHHLLPTSDHTVYSLRHSFEDRLSLVEPPEKVQSFIMGHKYRRERYGDGPTLAQKKNWLDKMCFKVFE